MINQIINYFNGEVFMQFVEASPIVLALIILGLVIHYVPKKIELSFQAFITKLPLLGKAILLVFMIYLVAQFKSSDIQPFIYFQF